MIVPEKTIKNYSVYNQQFQGTMLLISFNCLWTSWVYITTNICRHFDVALRLVVPVAMTSIWLNLTQSCRQDIEFMPSFPLKAKIADVLEDCTIDIREAVCWFWTHFFNHEMIGTFEPKETLLAFYFLRGTKNLWCEVSATESGKAMPNILSGFSKGLIVTALSLLPIGLATCDLWPSYGRVQKT